jgi:hypothetical protein
MEFNARSLFAGWMGKTVANCELGIFGHEITDFGAYTFWPNETILP